MQQLTNISNAILTMTSREIAELVEQRHDNVKRRIDALADSDFIVQPQIEDEQTADAMGRPRSTQVYRLDKRSSFIVVAQLSPRFTARLVDRWQELEAKPAAPAALSVMDILHIAMEAEKGRLLAIEQRDHAIATKAHIGSKREATAMATASAAKKESASLKAQLGFNAQHATVKAVQAATGKPYAWLPLRRWCEALNQQPKNVTDPLYGAVKAWPGGAWMACYSVDLVDLFGEVAA